MAVENKRGGRDSNCLKNKRLKKFEDNSAINSGSQHRKRMEPKSNFQVASIKSKLLQSSFKSAVPLVDSA